MTFTWTRDGERITSTCPRCHATETSRFPADVRRWQRSHTAFACWRSRQADRQVTHRASHETMKTAPTEVVEHLNRGLTNTWMRGGRYG